jgi:very-short-patch-repair endonuclease
LFDCADCGHAAAISPNNIKNGKWCVHCSTVPKLCGKKDCNWCFNKSFASHPQAFRWSKKNELDAWQIGMHSNKKFWFYCKECKHRYMSTVNNVANGNGCPYCSITTRLCGEEDCKHCFDNSFASTPKSQYWSDKNVLKPWQVAGCSNKKFFLDCPDCGTCFLSSLNSVTSSGRFCPNCKNKTEKMLTEHLDDDDVCNEKVIREATLAGCKSKQLLRFDYLVEAYKLIIELDGRQHFEDVPFFANMSLKENQKRDHYKTAFAISQGYTVIRVLQLDVYLDRNNWKDRLKAHLRLHKKPRAIFLDNKTKKYDPLRKLLTDSETDYMDA